MLSRRSGRPEPGLLYPHSPSQQEPLSSSSETWSSLWKWVNTPTLISQMNDNWSQNISPLDKWVRPGQTLEGFKTATSWPRCSQRDYMTHLRPVRCQRKSANGHFSDDRDKVRGELLVFPFPLYSCWACEGVMPGVPGAILRLRSASKTQKANILNVGEQKRRKELGSLMTALSYLVNLKPLAPDFWLSKQ